MGGQREGPTRWAQAGQPPTCHPQVPTQQVSPPMRTWPGPCPEQPGGRAGKDQAPLYSLLTPAALGVALRPLPGQEEEGREAKTDLPRAAGEGVRWFPGASGRIEGLAEGWGPANWQSPRHGHFRRGLRQVWPKVRGLWPPTHQDQGRKSSARLSQGVRRRRVLVPVTERA